MKIIEISDSAVTLSSGALKSANEVMWNYRSECCQAPLDFVGGVLICAYCSTSEGLEIIHKTAILSGGVQIAEAINALPEAARDRATKGYYGAIDDPSIKIVHVFDLGGEYELPELPQQMRRLNAYFREDRSCIGPPQMDAAGDNPQGDARQRRNPD